MVGCTQLEAWEGSHRRRLGTDRGMAFGALLSIELTQTSLMVVREQMGSKEEHSRSGWHHGVLHITSESRMNKRPKEKQDQKVHSGS